jgi:multiple sugar transport system permease protein
MSSETARVAPRPSLAANLQPLIGKSLLLIVALLWIIPMIWMLVLSLTPNTILQENPTILIPRSPTLANFVSIFQVGLTTRWFMNSVIVTGVTTVMTIVLQSMAAYAVAKIPFQGKAIVYPALLAGMMVPKEAMFIPLFLMFAEVQMHNTHVALILPRVAIPLGVFLVTQFMMAIPSEIEEATEIDGAGRWTIFWRIIMPMSRPALTALAVFTFILTWNDYLWPLVSATEKEMFTITTGLASLQGNFAQATELGSLMARGVIAALPLMILFLIFQKNLLRGISMTSGGK